MRRRLLPPRLLVFDDPRRAAWVAALMNTRRGAVHYRVTPTTASDEEILRPAGV